MKLSQCQIGDTYSVEDIQLGEDIKRRLLMLGMTYGTKITVLNKKGHGAMIIKLRGTRFTLGKDFCSGIMVGGKDDE